jgi:uncharacterized damage-inducible protein DinB
MSRRITVENSGDNMMKLSQENAAVVARYLLADYEQEMQTTRKVIAAMPEGQPDYAPSAKCMPALKLAFHLPSAEAMFLDGILAGAFTYDPKAADSIQSVADVLAWADAHLPPLVEKARQAPAEVWTRELDFFGVMKMTGLEVLSLLLKHSIHHRGQLSSYLRPMGGKVPGIYGPSADDK